MKADDLIPQAGNFVTQFVAIVSGPKKFSTSIDFSKDTTFKDALLFFALSVVISVMLDNFYTTSAVSFFESIKNVVIFNVVLLLVSSAMIFISWKLVKGTATYRQQTTLVCYFTGISLLIWSVSALLSKGYLKHNLGTDFEHAIAFINLLLTNSDKTRLPEYQAIAANSAVTNGLLIFACGIIVSFLWLLVSWRSYRILNKRSWGQAIIALLVFLMLSYPVTWLFQIVQYEASIILF
ncbi:MAG: hypothetical protein ACJAVV_002409 [Alphaproteobacteria bacterium]|jgi:hypothetical protein